MPPQRLRWRAVWGDPPRRSPGDVRGCNRVAGLGVPEGVEPARASDSAPAPDLLLVETDPTRSHRATSGPCLRGHAPEDFRSVAAEPVSYTHLRAHETRHDLVCRLLL